MVYWFKWASKAVAHSSRNRTYNRDKSAKALFKMVTAVTPLAFAPSATCTLKCTLASDGCGTVYPQNATSSSEYCMICQRSAFPIVWSCWCRQKVTEWPWGSEVTTVMGVDGELAGTSKERMTRRSGSMAAAAELPVTVCSILVVIMGSSLRCRR